MSVKNYFSFDVNKYKQIIHISNDITYTAQIKFIYQFLGNALQFNTNLKTSNFNINTHKMY